MKCAVITLIALFVPGVGSAQIIGAVQLRLGAPEERVLSSLTDAGLDVTPIDGLADGYAVKPDESAEANGLRGGGFIQFRDGQLASVDRSWPEGRTQVSFGRAVIQALSGTPDDECRLVPDRQVTPGVEIEQISIHCGPDYRVTVSYLRAEGNSEQVSVSEKWGGTEFR